MSTIHVTVETCLCCSLVLRPVAHITGDSISDSTLTFASPPLCSAAHQCVVEESILEIRLILQLS